MQSPTPLSVASLTPQSARDVRGANSEWSALAASAANGAFAGPDAVGAYLDAFAPDSVLLRIDVHRQRELIGTLPLIRERRSFHGLPVRTLRVPLRLNAPEPFDVACADCDGTAVAASIWNALRARRDWDVIELVDLPEDGPGWRLMQLAAAAGYPVGRRESRRSPFIPIPATGATLEGAMAATQTRFRANLRRRMRNLEKIGPVGLKRYIEFHPGVFEQFLELEHSGWKGRNGTSILSDESVTRYYRMLAQGASRGGHLAIYALESDGEPIAMHLGIVIGGRYMVPKLTYSELHHEFAPGHLLIQEVLRDCVERGLTEFDFLGDEMPWKMEWTDQIRLYHRVHIFNRTLAGRAAYVNRYQVLTRARAAERRIAAVGQAITRVAQPPGDKRP